MTLEEEYRLSFYKVVARLSPDHAVWLVQNTESGKLFVKKSLVVFHSEIYRWLLQNPVQGMPRIFEAIEDNGRLIVIEEYLSGDTLEELLSAGKTFSPEEAANLMIELCEILRELHRQDPPIVHRDVKPSNIIISPDGRLKLLDMNAAKVADATESRDTEYIGTEGYAAPEQYGFGASGPRTDIYAVGVVLNRMLTGKLPGEKLAEGGIGKLVAACIRVDQERRFADMDELIDSLDAFASYGRLIPDANSYVIPGFRTKTNWKIIAACIGYELILYFGLSIHPEGADTAYKLWVNRICFILGMVGAVFFAANYRNIWKRVGIKKLRNPVARTIAVAFGCFVILLIAAIVTILLEGG